MHAPHVMIGQARLLRWALPLGIALRIALLCAGPDPDSDAYGHARIGRILLERPLDLDLHWVWLPLWHVVFAAVAWLGGGMLAARALSLLATAASAVLVYALVREEAQERPDALADFAASAFFLLPLVVREGGTAEPEACFTLAVLAAMVAWRRGHRGVTGGLLAAACLLRYEAWLLPPLFAFAELRWARPAGIAGATRPALGRAAKLLLPPLAAVGAWCIMHGLHAHEPLRFLRENREFARHANRALGFPWGQPGVVARLRQLTHYTVEIPARQLVALAVPFAVGAWRLRSVQRAGMTALVGVAMVSFLTYGCVVGQHLGLVRHAALLAPALAVVAAHGVQALGERLRFVTFRTALAALLLTATLPAFALDWVATRRAWPEARAAAAAAASAAGASCRLVTDDAMVELLTGLPRERVTRGASTEALAGHGPPDGACVVVVVAAGAPRGDGAAEIVFEDAHRRVVVRR